MRMAQFYVAGNALTGWGVWALAAIFVVPFVPLAWGVVQAWRRRRRIAARFRERASDKGLSPGQSRLLLRLARRQGTANPLDVLRSAARFDRCVHGDGRLVGRKTARELRRIRALLGFDRLLPGDRVRSTRQLGRGHRLLLRRANGTDQAGVPWVIEAQDDHALVATPLLSDPLGGIEMWQPASRVEGQFRHGTDSTYGFVTDVLAVEAGAQRVLLRHTQRVERVQQRAFFRLRTQFAIVLLVGEGAAPVNPEQARRLEGTVVDISGGGLSVRVPESLPENTHVTVNPGFAGPFPLAGARCEVVAAMEREGGVQLRLRFCELADQVEAAIVRAIYERQVRARETQGGPDAGAAARNLPRASTAGT